MTGIIIQARFRSMKLALILMIALEVKSFK